MGNRVVVTGLGVVSPNGVGIPAFLHAIKNGISGIRPDPQLSDLKFSCQISGKPEISDEVKNKYFDDVELIDFNSQNILYGVIAGMEAWQDAGLSLNDPKVPDWDSGTIFGTGTSGVDKFREAIYKIDDLQTRRLGSSVVGQTMVSGVSAYLGGKLGLGNQVSTNSSACSTGTESIIMAYERIKNGHAKRMLAGSTSDSGPYIWAVFDALRICASRYNNQPEKACRPMSESAGGIVPSSGAGALVLESLESAKERGAKIYAEILGGSINSGGHLQGGSMTAPNSTAVQRCIQDALRNCGLDASEIDVINGHLTATAKDDVEIQNWASALQREGDDFPYIQALKSMIGHSLSASGSIETIASILQLNNGFLFPNINCEDLNPKITAIISSEKIPQKYEEKEIQTILKASFGFGDVNACLGIRKY